VLHCADKLLFVVAISQGEPLILLQECWKFMSLKFKIYSILTDECGQRRQHMFKMCSIKRVRGVPVLSPISLHLSFAYDVLTGGLFVRADEHLRYRRVRDQDGHSLHSAGLPPLPQVLYARSPPSKAFERNWLRVCSRFSPHLGTRAQ
jgi:hypothetical protein